MQNTTFRQKSFISSFQAWKTKTIVQNMNLLKKSQISPNHASWTSSKLTSKILLSWEISTFEEKDAGDGEVFRKASTVKREFLNVPGVRLERLLDGNADKKVLSRRFLFIWRRRARPTCSPYKWNSRVSVYEWSTSSSGLIARQKGGIGILIREITFLRKKTGATCMFGDQHRY